METVVPERLRRHRAETALVAPDNHYMEPISFDPSVLSKAIRHRRNAFDTTFAGDELPAPPRVPGSRLPGCVNRLQRASFPPLPLTR